jgi:GT2 family glycosyltransferase
MSTKTSNKIFVGIVTCNRPTFFKSCYQTIKKCLDVSVIAVVNDGVENVEILAPDIYIKHTNNKGVGVSKNELFKEALKIPDIEHIFIVEDDIIVKDCAVFSKYIEARNVTGLHHFMFGYHGPANKNNISKGSPVPRYIIDYGVLKLAINTHSVGAFCYYSREVLEKVGLFDENFVNAFDHVDHDYRIAKAGYCTPYWNWPDIANSVDYLDEIECSENSSAIKPREDWMENIKKAVALFEKKHGYLPAWQNSVPDTSKQDVVKFLKKIKP